MKYTDANWLREFAKLLRREHRPREAELCDHCAYKMEFMQLCCNISMGLSLVMFLGGAFLLAAYLVK
jgi:hypothetical protein